MCTGTLVKDPDSSRFSRWVLTAAHCGSHPKDLDASFFVSCEGSFHQVMVPVKRVHRPFIFAFGDRDNDLALFELEKEMPQEEVSRIHSSMELEDLVTRAREYHRFEVQLIDSGVTGTFGKSRFSKEYHFINEADPFVECAVVGMGKNEKGRFGHLQHQGLSPAYFLDLDLNHLFLSYSKADHGFLLQPGDSGGPLLCQLKGSSQPFVLGVHSHSMEEASYSFSTPSHRYMTWIREVQMQNATPY